MVAYTFRKIERFELTPPPPTHTHKEMSEIRIVCLNGLPHSISTVIIPFQTLSIVLLFTSKCKRKLNKLIAYLNRVTKTRSIYIFGGRSCTICNDHAITLSKNRAMLKSCHSGDSILAGKCLLKVNIKKNIRSVLN